MEEKNAHKHNNNKLLLSDIFIYLFEQHPADVCAIFSTLTHLIWITFRKDSDSFFFEIVGLVLDVAVLPLQLPSKMLQFFKTN